jgi:hypothetical protein
MPVSTVTGHVFVATASPVTCTDAAQNFRGIVAGAPLSVIVNGRSIATPKLGTATFEDDETPGSHVCIFDFRTAVPPTVRDISVAIGGVTETAEADENTGTAHVALSLRPEPSGTNLDAVTTYCTARWPGDLRRISACVGGFQLPDGTYVDPYTQH